ncbi:MAG: indole-3-glycerol phosphate synthase TrpC [candidate division WOR-3 bacterium]
MNMLSVIIEETKKDLYKKKSQHPMEHFLKATNKIKNDFKKIFKEKSLALIAEIKNASPSTGIIRDDLNPEKVARIYESAGVDAISVVTNKKFFKGKKEYIEIVKKSTTLPVLRKDFIIDEYQIYESYAVGADAILFISCILPPVKLKKFVKLAHKLGMTTIVEIHTINDLKKALDTETEIIGINNRNLNNFSVDINNSLHLIQKVPEHYYTVSESGIKSQDDVRKLKNAGFDGLLVGTSILKADNMVAKIKELKWIN